MNRREFERLQGLMDEEMLETIDRVSKDLKSAKLDRRTFLAALPILLGGCATFPEQRHRSREGDNTGQETSLTVEDERKMTQEVLPEIKKDYPPLNDPYMQNYVADLGQKIAAANKLEGNPYNYNFSVVDVDYVNAFALPAGTIMVTAPLIEMAETEAELAGVVGHEIGHVKARHTAERMEAQKKAQGRSLLWALGGSIAGAAAGYAVGKMVCPPKDSDCIRKSTTVGVAAGAGAGFLVAKYPFMANSREDEMEADRIGFRTSVVAGYSKDHVGNFYEKLLAMEQKRGVGGDLFGIGDALSTHPPSKERVQQMKELAASQVEAPGAITSRAEFVEAKKRLAARPKRAKS